MQSFFFGRSEFARHFLDGVSVTDISFVWIFLLADRMQKAPTENSANSENTRVGKVQFRKNFVECGKRALPWSVSGFLGRVNIVIISLLDLSMSNDLSFAVKLD